MAVTTSARYESQERLNSGSWSTIHDASGTSKAISGKTTGTWGYRMRACNVAGCAAWSGIKAVQVTRPPANAPTGLTAPDSSATGSYSVA
ncbi:hypothetical protein [Luteimonas salinilitoris]|uniref:Fibronectin type-III domain-containing protein n=1 Tax=Luteimonas salinilitoris TaxID=3237697 RepID=A0ABV4HQ86_9GAMM